MARQYKALQEELIYKINALETQLTEQKEELDITNHELLELHRDKDEDIDDKDKQIQQLNERMNDMSTEFSNMLTETLDLMRTQISEKLQDGGDQEADRAEFAQRLQDYSTKAYNAVSVNSRAIADKGDKAEKGGDLALPALA
uniref:Dynein regulatory complex protein 12 n=1 Tax=Zooxanthella nutricula TaxID=1333877 RepID=A0A7S2PEA6_9DINO